MSVESTHADFMKHEARCKIVNDACSGSLSIKRAGYAYLPQVIASDDAKENDARNEAYRARAVFFEITKDTLNKMLGIAFADDPHFQPDGMDFLKNDADGSGKSIYQLAQTALSGLLKNGRGGLFVDYPQTNGDSSVSDMESKGIRPTIVHYTSSQIINWRVKRVGSMLKTSLIVLSETETQVSSADEFSQKVIQVYRVLRLDKDGYYTVQIYSDRDGALKPDGEPTYPTNSKNQKWTEIPFIPLGAFSNDWDIDPIPLESLALMNIAHYHNSAEYENTVFVCGQAQAVVTGLDEAWRNHLEEKGMFIGASTPILLPIGATFSFAQANEKTIAKEAMEAKEKYMQSLGAKLLEESQVIKTATQSNNESVAQHSVLSLCVANINEAFELVLRWCAEYHGVGNDAKFSIKQDFAKTKLSLDDLKFYNELMLQGKLSQRTFHEMRTTGKVPEIDFEAETKRIEEENEGSLALSAE